MEKKFITLQGLKEVLSDGELKNVLGGSGTGPDSCGDACNSNADCKLACLHCVDINNWPGKYCMSQA